MLPVQATKKARPTRYGRAFVARRPDGAILLRLRPPRGLLGGMSEVPGTEWAEARAPVGTYPVTGDWRTIPSPVQHTFTHFMLKLSVERADVSAGIAAPSGHWWAAANGLAGEALPSVMKKAIEAAYPGATRPSQQ